MGHQFTYCRPIVLGEKYIIRYICIYMYIYIWKMFHPNPPWVSVLSGVGCIWNGCVFSPLSVKIYWKQQTYKQIIIAVCKKCHTDMWTHWCGNSKGRIFFWACACCYFFPSLASLSRCFVTSRQSTDATAFGVSTERHGLLCRKLSKVVLE